MKSFPYNVPFSLDSQSPFKPATKYFSHLWNFLSIVQSGYFSHQVVNGDILALVVYSIKGLSKDEYPHIKEPLLEVKSLSG